MRLQVLFILVITVLLGNACGKTNAAETTATKARQVKVITVQSVDYQEVVKASGRLASKEEMNLSFKTGGIIQRILVKEGQKVRKGQLLAVLELDEINAQAQSSELAVDKAGLDVENAKLALQLAERDFRNTKALYEDSVATLEQMENVEVQLQNARNQLEVAQTGLALGEQNQKVADFNLRYSKIVAPSNGTILKQRAEVNEIVGPGKPVFLFGTRDKAQVIKIKVTDKDVVQLRLGDTARILFDAHPDLAFRGTVREIAGGADPTTGTYEVELEVDTAGENLLSGFIGRVEIATLIAENLIRLDASALVSAEADRGVVYVVMDGIARRRELGIHKLDGGAMLIKSGLQEGEQVVLSGAGYLEDGQKVIVVE